MYCKLHSRIISLYLPKNFCSANTLFISQLDYKSNFSSQVFEPDFTIFKPEVCENIKDPPRKSVFSVVVPLLSVNDWFVTKQNKITDHIKVVHCTFSFLLQFCYILLNSTVVSINLYLAIGNIMQFYLCYLSFILFISISRLPLVVKFH